MSEKDKKKQIPDKSEEKKKAKVNSKANANTTAKPVSVKEGKPESLKPRHRRGGLLGSRSKRGKNQFPVNVLARRTDTDSIVMGALRVVYGWSDRTILSQAEFIRLRDAWLKRPIKEG